MTSEPDSQDQPDPQSTPREPVRMCQRCSVITKHAIKVLEIHSDSGPGWNVYVCADCAPRYPTQCDPIAMFDKIERFRRTQRGDAS